MRVFRIALEMPRKKKEESSFGPRLAVLRKARGLAKIQLAEVTGSTPRKNGIEGERNGH